jgi:hypothetical protein
MMWAPPEKFACAITGQALIVKVYQLSFITKGMIE